MSFRLVLMSALLVMATPGAATAAVPVDGLVYSPRNGAELVEAADLVSALPEAGYGNGARIELAARDYEVTQPVVIAARRDALLVGPETGAATITNAAGTAGALLRVASLNSPRRVVVEQLSVEVTGASPATFAAIEAGAGTDLVDVDLAVPAATPNATAARIGAGGRAQGNGQNATGTGLQVRSQATGAPAVTLESEAKLNGSEVIGGEPTVRLQRTREAFWDRHLVLGVWGSTLTAGPATKRVVEVISGSSTQNFELRASELRAGPQTTAVVDVSGQMGPPTFGRSGLTAIGLTVLGGGHATGVVFHPGSADSEPLHYLGGFLQLDGPVALACAAGPGASFEVGVRGVYREGTLDPGGDTCHFNERDRRTGDPKFRDRAAGNLEPLLGSSLIDAAPSAYWPEGDLRGNPRPSERNFGAGGVPGDDIGAIEYQYSEPVIDEIWVAEPGNRGLVQLEAAAHDTSAEEDAAHELTYEWSFEDGTVLTGASVEYRLAVPANMRFEDWYPAVHLRVLDASGTATYESVALDPWIAECESATDDVAYQRRNLCPLVEDNFDRAPFLTPRPRPTPTAAPRPTPFVRPTPTPTPTPKPALVSGFELLRSRASARSRRATGIARSHPNDAALRLNVTAPAKLRATVARKSGSKWKTVRRAAVTAELPKGRSVLRITPRFGKAKLKKGVYRVTVTLTPTAGGAATTRTANVRFVG